MELVTKFTASMILMAIAVAPSARADIGDQLHKLLANDVAESDHFCLSIAIDNGIVAAGAFRDDDNGAASGSAYLFEASTAEKCFWDLNDDRTTGTADLLVFIGFWGIDPGGPPDFDGNGIVGTSDLLSSSQLGAV